jgi:hypothetical protein
VFEDSIVVFCQFIDRTVTVLCSVVNFLEIIIFQNQHYTIFHNLDKIDNILVTDFKIAIDRKKDLFFNSLFCAFNLTTISMFISRAVQGNLEYYYFLTFTLSSVLVGVVEMFYVAIMFHIYRRFKIIENFTEEEKNLSFYGEKIYNIFEHTFDLFGDVNHSFGRSILMNSGKI